MMRCPISASRPAAANPALEAHQRKLGRMPRRVAADAGYYSQTHEEAARKMGVDYVSIPNRSTRSEKRRKLQTRRWFNNGQNVAHRMRGPNPYGETSPRTGAVPVSRPGRKVAMGRTWGRRRQPHQYRQTPDPENVVSAMAPPTAKGRPVSAGPDQSKSLKKRYIGLLECVICTAKLASLAIA